MDICFFRAKRLSFSSPLIENFLPYLILKILAVVSPIVDSKIDSPKTNAFKNVLLPLLTSERIEILIVSL